jgi:hypothetical protein
MGRPKVGRPTPKKLRELEMLFEKCKAKGLGTADGLTTAKRQIEASLQALDAGDQERAREMYEAARKYSSVIASQISVRSL